LRVKNNKESSDVWAGMTIAAGAEYDLQAADLAVWKANDKVIQDLASLELLIGDGTSYKTTGSEAVNYLLGTSVDVKVNEAPPFSSKKIGSKKLYTRATGKAFTVSVGSNNLDFLIPYNEMKINGIEIVNGKVGEKVNLKVLDTAAGTISTVPNYMLNQFGFDVNLPDGMFVRESQYDADMIKDLVIRIEYTAIEARDVRVNYLIHELKT